MADFVFDTHQIKIEESGEYKLVCFYGYSINGKHRFFENSWSAINEVAKSIKPCDCADCKKNLEG